MFVKCRKGCKTKERCLWEGHTLVCPFYFTKEEIMQYAIEQIKAKGGEIKWDGDGPCQDAKAGETSVGIQER